MAALIIMSGRPSYGAGDSMGLCSELGAVPKKLYVQVDLDTVPELHFYRSKQMTGTPALDLNDQGLFLEEKLVCAWPGGSFMAEPEPNRVLASANAKRPGSCPAELPIKSGFPRTGARSAILCIEVEQRLGEVIEVSYKRKPYYLDLNSLAIDKWRFEALSEKK